MGRLRGKLRYLVKAGREGRLSPSPQGMYVIRYKMARYINRPGFIFIVSFSHTPVISQDMGLFLARPLVACFASAIFATANPINVFSSLFDDQKSGLFTSSSGNAADWPDPSLLADASSPEHYANNVDTCPDPITNLQPQPGGSTPQSLRARQNKACPTVRGQEQTQKNHDGQTDGNSRNQESTDPNIEPIIPYLKTDVNICEPYIVGNRPYPVCSSGIAAEVWWNSKWKAYYMAYATRCMSLSIFRLLLSPNMAVTITL